jgi:hypothetical protein
MKPILALPLSAAVLALAPVGCSKPEPGNAAVLANETGTVTGGATGAALDNAQAAPGAAGPVAPPRDLTGRWIGVEGMVLTVSEGAGPGLYTLDMQYDLDHKGRFAGRAQGDGIAFDRDGKALLLRPTDGAATGLKYLAGKTDCLTVAAGEGYCRG